MIVPDLKLLAQQYQKAKIFFHKDLDGVTSAIAMRVYLEKAGIIVVDAETIQYGNEEYIIKDSPDDVMNVLVDFAHGKPMMKIHTDHHDHQVGVSEDTSTVFAESPSNAQVISEILSPDPIFNKRDIEIISMVDSADYSKYGITPEEVMVATVEFNGDDDPDQAYRKMGLATNKLILSYKNKKGFLASIVLNSEPSLAHIYAVIVVFVKRNGYRTPEEINECSWNYKIQRSKKRIQVTDLEDIRQMKNGESFLYGTTVFQKGGGFMAGKNQYDRYTILSIYPESHYLVTQWPMGMVQLTCNPFSQLNNDIHLGNLVMLTVMAKYKDRLESEVITLDRLKYEFERDIAKKGIQGAVGFVWHDFVALYEKNVKGISSSNKWWPNMVMDIANKPYQYLSVKQKGVLKKISVTAWDVIMASSGGHKSITNISGLNFVSNTKGLMNDICIDICNVMKDKQLS